MLRTSSSTTSTFLPVRRLIGLAQSLQHLLFVRRQVGRDADGETTRRFVEQPLGRLDVLQDDALGHARPAELRLLRSGPCRCKHTIGNSRSSGFWRMRSINSNPEMSGRPQIQHHAIELGLRCKASKLPRRFPRSRFRRPHDSAIRRCSGARSRCLQRPATGAGAIARTSMHPVESLLQFVRGGRLDQIRERAVSQVLAGALPRR